MGWGRISLLWASLFSLFIARPVAAQAAGDLPDAERARYVTEGAFLENRGFDDEKLNGILSALPRLEKADSALAKKIGSALKKHAPDKADPILELFALYDTDACVKRHVWSDGSGSFAEFFSKVVETRKELYRICAELKKGKNGEALKSLDGLIGKAPLYTDAYLHRAIARSRTGDAAGAGADYRESLKTSLRHGSGPKMECLCAPTLESDAAKLREKYRLSEDAKKEGVELFLGGDHASAIAKFDAALGHDPGDPETLVSRAVAREKAGNDPKGAVSDYQQGAKSAAKLGRWDIVADALLSSAKVGGADAKTSLPGAVEGLEDLVTMTSDTDWKRRAELKKELDDLKERLLKVMPDYGKKKPDPKPDGEPPHPEDPPKK